MKNTVSSGNKITIKTSSLYQNRMELHLIAQPIESLALRYVKGRIKPINTTSKLTVSTSNTPKNNSVSLRGNLVSLYIPTQRTVFAAIQLPICPTLTSKDWEVIHLKNCDIEIPPAWKWVHLI
jgi:hypothetical protein